MSNDNTGAAWPGDPYHRNINDESLTNYYRATGKADDNRKYNRFAILRDKIGQDIPIINLYYPTWESDDPSENIIKLEKVIGKVGSLQIQKIQTLPVPYTAADKTQVINTVMGML
ncbi:hypothetical protein [Peribacillus frigoritolerans]|uniref:hypothetical protein n=1 Tax=Peribacillus frigoritolerans TaxID=450367 RepID=UPI00227ED883|nr:hypothetical protein [Peribacillus frigoritolerans]MCY9139691.1 hypothetical protein [Peribacillus frigoritolerans]